MAGWLPFLLSPWLIFWVLSLRHFWVLRPLAIPLGRILHAQDAFKSMPNDCDIS